MELTTIPEFLNDSDRNSGQKNQTKKMALKIESHANILRLHSVPLMKVNHFIYAKISFVCFFLYGCGGNKLSH